MLAWAIVFLALALLAGGLGWTGVAGLSSEVATILFMSLIIMFLFTLFRKRRLPMD